MFWVRNIEYFVVAVVRVNWVRKYGCLNQDCDDAEHGRPTCCVHPVCNNCGNGVKIVANDSERKCKLCQRLSCKKCNVFIGSKHVSHEPCALR